MIFSFTFEGFHLLYAAIAVFMTVLTSLFTFEYLGHEPHKLRYWFFVALTMLAAVGVFLSDNFMTTFICFEVVSLASYPLVAHEETKEALRAGETYLATAIIGGMVALMGLSLLNNTVGTLDFNTLAAACAACADKNALALASGCLLFGFGAKAGMFPLHIWLPEAHPVAPAPASALLSGILTKVGVYGILATTVLVMTENETWGLWILILGTITMLLGAILALLSVNLKRTLACSSVSQIGFILVGVGMMALLGEENTLAIRGTLLHMVNHSLFKLVLFMAAGAVFMNTRTLDLNKLRGFGRGKPFLMFVYLAGAFGIIGIPGFSGYVSKTLLHESIVEYAHVTGSVFCTVIEWLFLLAGGMTVAYMTKLFVVLFIEKTSAKEKKTLRKRWISPLSRIAFGVPALLIPVLGCSTTLMDRAADLGQGFLGGAVTPDVSYFAIGNLKGAGISITLGAIIYFVFVRGFTMKKRPDGKMVYVNRTSAWLSLENSVYRPLLEKVLPAVLGWIATVFDRFPELFFKVCTETGAFVSRVCDRLRTGW
ncbi:MAG: NADH dehydrogenase [Clostridiales bacterium]|nr:NADH dehydrogenase [Clostridiales bacterium]